MNNTSLNLLYLLIELVRAMRSCNYAVSAYPGFDSGLHCYSRVMIESKEIEKLAPSSEISFTASGGCYARYTVQFQTRVNKNYE